eukprot:gene15304-18124_t
MRSIFILSTIMVAILVQSSLAIEQHNFKGVFSKDSLEKPVDSGITGVVNFTISRDTAAYNFTYSIDLKGVDGTKVTPDTLYLGGPAEPGQSSTYLKVLLAAGNTINTATTFSCVGYTALKINSAQHNALAQIIPSLQSTTVTKNLYIQLALTSSDAPDSRAQLVYIDSVDRDNGGGVDPNPTKNPNSGFLLRPTMILIISALCLLAF